MLGGPTTAHLTRSASCTEVLHHSKTLGQEEGKTGREGPCLKGIPEEEEEEGGGGEEGRRRKCGSAIWGVGCRSEADLPASVAACFEDTSLLARLQNRLLSLVGRASRYRLQRGLSTPVMPLEALRRKVKEARLRLLPHASPPSSTSPRKKDPGTKTVTPDSPASRLSSPSLIRDDQSPCRGEQRKTITRPMGCSSLQQYWTGEGSGEEEIELLQQYLNLQQLAVSRKHSTQLRRIRDSLLARVRSRPTSMVKSPTSPPPPAASTPNKDRQALRNFLLDIGFVQYYSLLNRHGYDLPTAAHMDALDLAGVGITEPLHRMAIKFEFDLVRRPPPVPDEVPETIQEWLEGLGLPDYVENFHQNGLYCPLAALGLTKRDLQLMGVYMLGHRKKILLAIIGLKEALFRKEGE
ncbi:LOW QUALITY PROTEIN: caskin-2 [Procambarus clarkii]|uniref:LOW QUALITY PROTEIN: caskin-2 n=1 Tax=Procambarus clarkii TaxID=6728 RepID=UPI001E675030|nr:caskin-2-like [Procambarus clarkii]